MCVCDPAPAAARVLLAFRSGNLDRLEAELARAAAPDVHPGLPALAAEQRDALAAIAQSLRAGIQSMKRGRSRRLEGAASSLALLNHLAESGAYFSSSRMDASSCRTCCHAPCG